MFLLPRLTRLPLRPLSIPPRALAPRLGLAMSPSNGISNGIHTLPEVYIVAACRTPVGSFAGTLKPLSAVELGAQVVKATIARAGITPEKVEELFIGHVLQAGVGQSPARQVALGAGCPDTTEATTINKVCASGMKAIILATQSLQTGARQVMVAGGMESMSNAPFYIPRGSTFGHFQASDAIVKDGLWDVYNQIHMGTCAESIAETYSITREDQDAYAIESYRRAAAAWASGAFADEIVPIEIADKRGGRPTVVAEDEEYKKVKIDKMASLKPVFKKEAGTITAANASTLNDGASAVVLMTSKKADELGVSKIAKIISYADAACAPVDFGIAPVRAMPLALEKAGLSIDDIAKIEINEAFSAVALANIKLLKLNPELVNVSGGAVALGHPIGSSGSRIVVSLAHSLKKGEYGLAGICNGGGAASAIVIQRV